MRCRRVVAAAWLCMMPVSAGVAAPGDPPALPKVDPAPCHAAIAASDDGAIIRACDALIDNDMTERADRLKALLARGGAYQRGGNIDRAIVDYDVALRLDPRLADIFNVRGELYRSKGDRPRALADFATALKLDARHEAARTNFKSLALELEKLGAEMGSRDRARPALK